MSYAQKLRSPQWQKKRLQILERDNWTCQCCGSTEKNLQVHHLFYAKREPWDYPDEAYQTLCEDCHSVRQKIVDEGVERLRVRLADVPTSALVPFFSKLGAFPKQPMKSGPLNIYLAGKVGKECWRTKIVDDLRNRGPVGVCLGDEIEEFPEVVHGVIFGEHHYVGPFFVGCDHGCFHGENTHGSADGTHGRMPQSKSEAIRKRALDGISRCDLFFAFIDSTDCYGTLFEIGYANALGKKVVIATDGDFPDLWFCLHPEVAVFNLKNGEVNSSPENLLRHIIDTPFAREGRP